MAETPGLGTRVRAPREWSQGCARPRPRLCYGFSDRLYVSNSTSPPAWTVSTPAPSAHRAPSPHARPLSATPGHFPQPGRPFLLSTLLLKCLSICSLLSLMPPSRSLAPFTWTVATAPWPGPSFQSWHSAWCLLDTLPSASPRLHQSWAQKSFVVSNHIQNKVQILLQNI